MVASTDKGSATYLLHHPLFSDLERLLILDFLQVNLLLFAVGLQNLQELLVRIRFIGVSRFDFVQVLDSMVELSTLLCSLDRVLALVAHVA